MLSAVLLDGMSPKFQPGAVTVKEAPFLEDSWGARLLGSVAVSMRSLNISWALRGRLGLRLSARSEQPQWWWLR